MKKHQGYHIEHVSLASISTIATAQSRPLVPFMHLMLLLFGRARCANTERRQTRMRSVISGKYDILQMNQTFKVWVIISAGSPSPSAASRPASERSVLLLHGPIGATLPEAGLPCDQNFQILHVPLDMLSDP